MFNCQKCYQRLNREKVKKRTEEWLAAEFRKRNGDKEEVQSGATTEIATIPVSVSVSVSAAEKEMNVPQVALVAV
jgi:hypothetical protein